jgi:hypothetical protein
MSTLTNRRFGLKAAAACNFPENRKSLAQALALHLSRHTRFGINSLARTIAVGQIVPDRFSEAIIHVNLMPFR